MIKQFAFSVSALLLAAAAWATPTGDLLAVRRARTKSVKMGIWHADLEKAKAYAERYGMPLIAVWSNGEECSHCQVFERMAMAPVFCEWMAGSGYIFYFGVRDDGPYGPTADGQEGYHGTSFYWCRMKNGSYDPNASQNWPYVRIYWKKTTGALKVDQFFTGAAVDGEYDAVPMPAPRNCADNPAKFMVKGDDGTYNPSARYFIHKMTNGVNGVLRNYVYRPVQEYQGGEFGVEDGEKHPKAQMQIEYGTSVTNVVVPLTRTNATAQASVATNFVVATYPSGKVKTNVVAWAANQATAVVGVKIAPSWLGDSSYRSPSNRIQLVLQNDKRTGVATNYIYCVTPRENSPMNPLWIGEKSEKELSWGEWTMDIDVATNKVNAARKAGDDKAYTLVLVGGPLWCPDCTNLETHVISTPSFAAWAADSHHIACVAIDEPPFKRGLAAPTLLSHATAERYSGVSGSGYLTRKGIAPEQASEILRRNEFYVNNDTAHGGLCLPENAASAADKTNGWKTGIPALILLRADGSVCGRIYQFSNSTEKLGAGSVRTLLRRLDELIAQDAERGEENNDSWAATAVKIGIRARRAATLSFADAADYYRIDGGKGTDVLFKLGADDAVSGEARLTLSIIDATKVRQVAEGQSVNIADASPVAAVTNTLSEGLMVSASLPSDDCYVRVGYPVDSMMFPGDPYFALDKETSTLCRYAIESDGIFNAAETLTLVELDDGKPEVSIYLVKGQTYRFIGIDETNDGNLEVLEKELQGGVWTGRWVSRVTAAATLVLETGEAVPTFGYQRWAPGAIGFERTAWSVSEPTGGAESYDYAVKIVRTGGLSGWAKARLSLDRASSTAIDDGSVYEWADEGRILAWGEGMNDTFETTIRVKANELADGDQRVTLVLTGVDGSDAAVEGGRATFTLTVRDDDEPVPGVLSIHTVNGLGLPAARRLSVRGGSRLVVAARRTGGAAGDLIGRLKVSAETVLSEQERVWPSRDAGEKTFEFDLPGYAAVPAHRVTVRLTGVDGARTDASANYLVVDLAPESAPALVDPGVLSATRWVNAGAYEIAVDPASVNSSGGAISATKTAGTLPPGIRWAFEGASEDPAAGAGRIVLTGTPTAAGTYTAYFAATQDGLTGPACAVTIDVADPASLSAGESAEANPSVAQARTYADVMVLDPDAGQVVGLVTLTIPPSGRLSARYRNLDGRSVALMSESWSACEGGDYRAELSSQSATAPGVSLSVVARKSGAVEAQLTDDAQALTCIIPRRNWSKQNPATEWKGYYTVSMPGRNRSAFACGDAYVTLRMTTDAAVNAGRVTYAGMLPNGKAFSGAATLFPGERVGVAEAVLPIFKTSASDSFAALYSLDMTSDSRQKVWAYDGARPAWQHNGGSAEASYRTDFDVYGCLYKQEDLVGCCTNKFGTQELTFFVSSTNLPASSGFVRNQGDDWRTDSTGIQVSSNFATDTFLGSSVDLADEEAAKKDNGLTWTWNRSTGIVSGELRFDFKDGASASARYRGVMMPWWGTIDCTDCSDVRCDKRPFISGACWFADLFAGADGQVSREIRGVPFSVGVVEGK